jgi:capsular polysaccharide export protein
VNSLAFCLSVPREKYPAVAISSAGWLNETNKYLPDLLHAEKLIIPKNDQLANQCAGFVQWGILESDSKARLRNYAASTGRPLAFIEDGFIRSLDIGLSQEPGRSIIMDDLGFYYDATKPSRLETILNSSFEQGLLTRWRTKDAIRYVTRNRISKYNNAPDALPTALAAPKRQKRILLIDQRAGDASIPGALASDDSFQKMVDTAFRQDAEVVVKIHPDALTPGKFSAISPSLVQYDKDPRLTVVSEAVNPYILFDAVDEVYVVASGMGFEAVLAGKSVSCFGVPYYAGWGVTTDYVQPLRPRRSRSVDDIFHVAWMKLSRYIDPKTKKLVSVKEAAKALAAERRAKGLVIG